MMLMAMQGDEVIRELTDMEDESQSDEFDELHFEKHELVNRHIVTRCHSGYELYQRLVCGILVSLSLYFSVPDLTLG